MNTPQRPIATIAREIRDLWVKECGPAYGQQGKKYYYAAQQLAAMMTLNVITDKFYEDDGYAVLGSFLSNVSMWKGEDARRLKKELNVILKG